MSKKKTFDSPETENQDAENLVEQQTELDGLSSAKEESVESAPNNAAKESAELDKAVSNVSVKANKTGKMGVSKFLMLYPQDVYMETLLRHYYPKSLFTKEEWFLRMKDILNTPIYN